MRRGMAHGARGRSGPGSRSSRRALAFESERLLAARLGQPLETVAEIDTRDRPPLIPETGQVALLRMHARVNDGLES